MIVMVEWKPRPWWRIQKRWVEYVPISRAASKVGIKKAELSRILEKEGKFQMGWATIYTEGAAKAAGKAKKER